MPIFNKTQEKQIELYIQNKDKFSNEELKDILINFITFKLDGSKYADQTIKTRLTSLNKRLIKYDILVLAEDRNKIVEEFQQDRKENPIQEKKDDEKMDIDMEEIEKIKTPYVQFLDNEENKEVFNNKKNRKKRNELIDKINGVYTLLQLNSGVRLNELLSKDFQKVDDKIVFKLSKADSKARPFKPLFMTPDEWLEILEKVRNVAGKERVENVNKRYNIYLKNTYNTIKKSHDFRKIYMYLSKDINKNPLAHSDPDMKKVYDVVKTNDEDKSKELKKQVKDTQDKNKKRCDICNITTSNKNWSRHNKSKKHLNLVWNKINEAK